MTVTTTTLTTTDTIAPTTTDEVCAAVNDAVANTLAIYPVGGGTSLDYGLPATTPGIMLSLANLNRVIDYPARDMTITIEAGITMAEIQKQLAAENQRLPIDVPQAETATLGGVIATNWNGPRRYSQGTVRDYVIGITAVDGHGTLFKGGGRVVKNVAGFDFCKLLTGSLGTLGVITSATLKVRPIPEESMHVVIALHDDDSLERTLAALVDSQTTPTSIEVVAGPKWQQSPTVTSGNDDDVYTLIVGIEGTRREVSWMIEQLQTEFTQLQLGTANILADEAAVRMWNELINWSATGESPLVLKANVVPSAVTKMCRALRNADANVSLQAHAGNGVVIAKFSEFPADGLSRVLLGDLQPTASSLGGNIVILTNPTGSESTRQSVWGGIDVAFSLMGKVKKQFDPSNVLNPGRFVFS